MITGHPFISYLEQSSNVKLKIKYIAENVILLSFNKDSAM